jgi:hypothetical protein
VSGADALEGSVVVAEVVELGITGVPMVVVVAGGRLSDVVFEVTDVGTGTSEALVASDSDWCRLVEPQPAARRVLMASTEAAVAKLTEPIFTLSGTGQRDAMGRAPLPW